MTGHFIVTHPSRDEILLSAEHLHFRQMGKLVLEDVSLQLHQGRLVSLIGPNGAGKTSLISLLLGLHKPQSGKIWRKDGLVIGYVPQRLHLNGALPVRTIDMLAMAGFMGSVEQQQIIDETGIEPVLHQALESLSGGQLQRVMLARAVMRNPHLLVLDEPAQGVDAAGEVALYGYIESLRQRLGCGVLMVSHDVHRVMASSDHVICLNRHICCEGKPDELRVHGTFKGMFPSYGDNAVLAPYRHKHDHEHGWHEGGDCTHG